eukprot:TRINITY_DN32406_c0_g1_i1.p1 TRINITY_DN32406_c0_g1~~TRINITY_DN32406_c0_g1_i1.p1  ORF type:complete len:268 (+),score=50.18 TRINITY_DN32406_c0_g1_i1:179-982(+)
MAAVKDTDTGSTASGDHLSVCTEEVHRVLKTPSGWRPGGGGMSAGVQSHAASADQDANPFGLPVLDPTYSLEVPICPTARKTHDMDGQFSTLSLMSGGSLAFHEVDPAEAEEAIAPDSGNLCLERQKSLDSQRPANDAAPPAWIMDHLLTRIVCGKPPDPVSPSFEISPATALKEREAARACDWLPEPGFAEAWEAAAGLRGGGLEMDAIGGSERLPEMNLAGGPTPFFLGGSAFMLPEAVLRQALSDAAVTAHNRTLRGCCSFRCL